MTNPQIIVLFIIGAILTLLGALLKIFEIEHSSFVLIIGMSFNSFAALLLLLKLFKNKSDSLQ